MTELSPPDIDAAHPIEEADVVVANILVPYAERGFVRAIGAASDLTDQEPLYAAAAAILATGVIMRDRRTVQAGLRVAASHLLATALRGTVKRLVDRTRPNVAAQRGKHELSLRGEKFESDFNSFPSGHTAGAVAFARAIGRHYPGSYGSWMGITAAASLAQVVRSKHYLTDVAAGVAIGWVAEAAINRLMRRAARI